MSTSSKPTKAEIMLAALQAAGGRGITAVELFDGHKIANPTFLTAQLTRAGHVVREETERLDSFERTIRYTLVHDASPQLALT